MIFKEFGIEIERVVYDTELCSEHGRQLAVITPTLNINSTRRWILIASLKVDGHELLPSDKINVVAGRSQVRLRQVRIFNPLPGSNMSGGPGVGYKMTLEVSAANGVFQSEESNLKIVSE